MQIQRFRSYIALMRLNRPVGIWLLLWPCWWSVALASASFPSIGLLLWFALGAVLMRSAGCIVNDIADRDIDALVARTKQRPLASGAVSLAEAAILLALLLLGALVVVLQLDRALVSYAVLALIFVGTYPYMKRVTYWPQAFLGLTFNMGALFGWVAVHGTPDWAALWLYAAGICWTIGYDTIYAHQDIEDDLRIGVKSTAIRFGEHNRLWIAAFYASSVLFFALALFSAESGVVGYIALAVFAAHLGWQCSLLKPEEPALALLLFKSNATLGGAVSGLLLVDSSLRTLL